MKNYVSFIEKTLTEASDIVNKYFGRVSGTKKTGDNNQVLTQADIEIGEYIVSKIETEFPKYNIIDEEAGVINKSGKYTWVVDPIDGTSNFAVGLPTYGIMIGLLDEDKAVAGGVILPAFDQLFLAQKGQGATLNNHPISVSDTQDSLDCLVAYGIDGHQENPSKTKDEVGLLGDIILNIRNLRTTNSAYDMAHVADGKFAAYLNRTTKIWDNVAIQPIIEEAGGVVTDFWGNPTDYANALKRVEENFTICAGSVAVHKKLQEIIHST